MARVISRAESWEKIHTAFTQINFNAFDYDTIKEALLSYVKIYYPEDFNDYIESSEFIAILELFAYVAGILAYRLDLNAHENFITTAERKESILRLAKLVSYKASRNIPARGLVKMGTIKTSEQISDSKGRNLANRTITWNDPNNPDWKEQFLLIINRVLEQDFGTVLPSERVQIGDVLFELYSFNNSPISASGSSVFKFNANGDMELVPIAFTSNGIGEKRPERNMKFSLIYSYDGLGDGSDTTGFLMYVKQGTMLKQQLSFDGKTPNQTYNIEIENINETDVWLNNIDATTGQIIAQNPNTLSVIHYSNEASRFGEWFEVDTVNSENIIFNTNENRHKYEIETLDDDKIKLVFGDGEFADIPSGTFDVWYRVSANSDDNVPKSAIQNQISSFNYVDSFGNNQTFTFSYSLISSLLNSSSSEELEKIRLNAPATYYSQNRMVNGKDYNSYMLQDPSIAKLRAINRTFAGDSKYMAWHDPKEYYENVKIFGDDSAIYWIEKAPDKGGLNVINRPVESQFVLENFVEPLLASADIYSVLSVQMQLLNIDPTQMRTTFSINPYTFDDTTNEVASIVASLDLAIQTTSTVDIYYSVIYDEWTVGPHPCDEDPTCQFGEANSIWCFRVNATFSGSTHSGWEVRWRTKRLIAHSEETKFWNTNTVDDLTDYDSFNNARDAFIILEANINANRKEVISGNRTFDVIGQELLEQNLPNAGLPDTHRLSVLPEDVNGDGIPDDLLQSDIFNYTLEQPYSWYVQNGYTTTPSLGSGIIITIPNNRNYLVGYEDDDLEVYVNGERLFYYNGGIAHSSNEAASSIVRREFQMDVPATEQDSVKIVVQDWVYFTRDSASDRWNPQLPTDGLQTSWALDTTVIDDNKRVKRHNGRYPMNFGWFHFVPTFYLVDPAASNIIDIFIVTQGYYTALTRWLEDRTAIEPAAPTPLDLRNSYNYLLSAKMISDTVVLQPGIFKILFGNKAIEELRARFKVIRPSLTTLSDNEVKVRIITSVKNFFDIKYWEFGEGFYFSELTASIHADLGPEIDSVVLVPTYSLNQFGDMYQVQARENELFIPDMDATDIDIVQEYTPENIKQNP